MRFKIGLALGIAIGFALAYRKLRSALENKEAGEPTGLAAHPATRKLAEQGKRVVGIAQGKGVEAIQRVRSKVQGRLVADADDLSMN